MKKQAKQGAERSRAAAAKKRAKAAANPREDALTARPSLARMRRALLDWYGKNQRTLPWRESRDGYRVWLSEVMLQQTRVAAVLEHYAEFLRRFPSLQALAAAPVEEVLAAWSGLGYYRRARMFHAAAREVATQREGRIPQTSRELRLLQGVGRYTAAAVASIAFGEAVAVVDGNVERILERIDGRPRRGEELWARAQELLEPREAGEWNQAMMDLGATICTPQTPACAACPWREFCRTRGALPQLPQPARKKKTVRYALIRRGDKVLLTQRPADAAQMPGLWELPEYEGAAAPAKGAAHAKKPAAAHRVTVSQEPGTVLLRLRHSITETDYAVEVLAAEASQRRSASAWFDEAGWRALPLTGLARKILRRL